MNERLISQVSSISRDAIDRHLARGREPRAEATAAMLAYAGRAVAHPLRPLVARLSVWRQQRQAHAALMRCSDRVLADIGIEREDIRLIAKGIDPHAPGAGRTVQSRWWQSMRVRLDAARRARREWHRIRGELMACDDRALDGLGIRRAEAGFSC